MAVVSRVQENLNVGNCLASDEEGNCVRVTGNQVNGLDQVTSVDPTNPAEDQAVGVIIEKIDPTTCLLIFQGRMRDVYTGLIPGKRYWVGSDAKLTEVRPSPALAGGTYNLQLMGVALDNEELLLNPQTPIVLKGT